MYGLTASVDGSFHMRINVWVVGKTV